MQVVYDGIAFDPMNDTDVRVSVARKRADQLLASMRDDADPVEVLRTFLTGMISYHIVSAATLTMAAHAGAAGISLRQALDQHNYIGVLLNEGTLEIPVLNMEESESTSEPNSTAARRGGNSQSDSEIILLDGDEPAGDGLNNPARRLVDQSGRPIPEGQQELPLPGDKLD
jgi:hypothetical protein